MYTYKYRIYINIAMCGLFNTYIPGSGVGSRNIFARNELMKRATKRSNVLQTNTREKTITFDHLIIGAGIGGIYLAARLNKLQNSKSILVVDKKNEIGGQQTSSITNDDVAIELGPIRFYESIHTRIKSLADKYSCPLIQYLPSEEGQVIYLRGKAFSNSNLFPDSDAVYNIDESEKGINPFVLLTNNLNTLISNTDDLYKLEYRIELIKNNPEFSMHTFKSLAKMNISDENWQRIMDILGYYDLLSNKSAFLINALESLALSNKSATQYRFKNGFSSLTKEIAFNNNIDTITFNNIGNSQNASCCLNTQVLKIVKSNNNNDWNVTLGYAFANSPEQINATILKTTNVVVKNIYYAGQLNLLSHLYNFNDNYLNYLSYSFINLSAIRIFIRYSYDWMSNRGIGFGKSVTTNDGGQIIHYADKYVMFYVLGTQAALLHSKMPSPQIQSTLISPNASNNELIQTCNDIIKQTFSITSLPTVTGVAWATWVAPFRLHTARNMQSLSSSNTIFDMMNIMMFPFGINGNFYVMSNEIGLNAAWCEGSVENVDYFLKTKYNEPLFGTTRL
jgi:hypothetical protein